MFKNKLAKLLLLTLVVLAVGACGKDDDEGVTSKSDLLQGGTWTFQKAVVSVMGQTMEMSLSDIRQMYASELGTSNIMFIDEKLRFDGTYMTMVNTGDRYRYTYSSNGTLKIEGMDEIDGYDDIDLSIKVKSVTENQLILRYEIKVEGMTITEDVYYKR